MTLTLELTRSARPEMKISTLTRLTTSPAALPPDLRPAPAGRTIPATSRRTAPKTSLPMAAPEWGWLLNGRNISLVSSPKAVGGKSLAFVDKIQRRGLLIAPSLGTSSDRSLQVL